MRSVDWKLKIEAFLYGLLKDEQIRSQASTVLSAISYKPPPEAEEAWEMALGSDVPPFVRGRNEENCREGPFLIHPLSGEEVGPERLNVNPQGVNANTLAQAVCSALSSFNSEEIDASRRYRDPEKLFLALWRLLPEKRPDPLGSSWRLLPSDRRVPAYPLWEHACMASALAATRRSDGWKPALLIFSIASAQDFIFASRRTQDFWMGSFLVSYLMWRAMRRIAERYGPDCILMPSLRCHPLVDHWLREEKNISEVPDPREIPGSMRMASFPNIFTALVPAGECVGCEVEKEVRNTVRDIFEAVRRWVERGVRQDNNVSNRLRGWVWNPDADCTWKRIWNRQREDFLEGQIFWVETPWDEVVREFQELLMINGGTESAQDFFKLLQRSGNPNDMGLVYHALATLAGRRFAACKNLRAFRQSEEPGHKCSQCGIREALHPEWTDTDPRRHYAELREFWNLLTRVEGSEVKLRGRIRPGDRLCAVCLTKRLAWEAWFIDHLKLDREEEHILFPSTASMATVSFKAEVLEAAAEDQNVREYLKGFVQKTVQMLKNHGIFYPSAVPPGLRTRADRVCSRGQPDGVPVGDFLSLDGAWLYEESFDAETIRREYGVTVQNSELTEARQALEKLLKALREWAEQNGRRPPIPSRYYAVLYTDGDDLGGWVSGARGPQMNKLLHPEIRESFNSDLRRPLGPGVHLTLAGILRDFALRSVPRVVHEHHLGQILYAGGDDLMALLPVREVPDAVGALRKLYTGEDFADGTVKAEGGLVWDGGRVYLAMGTQAGASAAVVIAHHGHPLGHVLEAVRTALKEKAKQRPGKDSLALEVLKRRGEPLSVVSRWFTRTGGKWVTDMLREAVEAMRSGKLATGFPHDLQAAGLEMVPDSDRDGGFAVMCRMLRRHMRSRDPQLECALGEMSYVVDTWEDLIRMLLCVRFIAVEG